MASLAGYSIGGTMHIITNNLLGFTANPEESNSTRFATDLAKRLPIPIFHVNGEDPDTAMRIAAIAAEYRQRFHSDVVVDLIGYRRYGHNEADDPTVTQPRRYAVIKQRPFLYQLYAKSIGVDPSRSKPKPSRSSSSPTRPQPPRPNASRSSPNSPNTGSPTTAANSPKPTRNSPPASLPNASSSSRASPTTIPPASTFTPKIQKLYEQRVEMAEGKRLFDYGAAELLAYASLLTTGTPVRLSGQDSQRGTFNQRHSVLVDMETEVRYAPLDHMTDKQARFEVHNSLLSEAACLGFEYGYARDYPEALVLWEAQFGDFVNGAQTIIDQFIAAGEAKWGLLSGLVMLLPHGYDGQGPEHSSARMERFLQLAASDNMVIAQPSNASQYFHLLRRQALRSWRKPLVVFTPKSMLRHPDAILHCRRVRQARLRKRPPRQRRQKPAPPPRLHRKDRPQPPRRTRETQRHSASASSSSSSYTPGPKPSCRPPSTSIPRPKRSSGSRRSPPTWEPSPTSCRCSAVSPAAAPCSA